MTDTPANKTHESAGQSPDDGVNVDVNSGKRPASTVEKPGREELARAGYHFSEESWAARDAAERGLSPEEAAEEVRKVTEARAAQREADAKAGAGAPANKMADTTGTENKGATGATVTPATTTTTEPEDYEGAWNKDELQAEVESRGLTVEGSGSGGRILKEDLVAALEADDKKKAK